MLDYFCVPVLPAFYPAPRTGRRGSSHDGSPPRLAIFRGITITLIPAPGLREKKLQ